eukprot:5244-Heterococcus_DN1.PRE.1
MKANAYSQQSSSTTLSSSSSHAVNSTAANGASANDSAYVSAAPVVVPFANKLPMPMSSPLIKYASVLQRKHEGVVKKSWAPCLVVMTVDRFLYVFDIKSHSDIDSSNNGAATAKPDEQHTQNTSGSSSSSDNATASTAAAAVAAIAAHTIGALSVEAAFDAILPHIDIKEPFKSKREITRAQLTPYIALDLSSHVCSPRHQSTKPKHDLQFYVTEIVKNDGLKGMIKKESCRKVSLRANTQADMIDW